MITIKRAAVIIFMIFFIFISAFNCRYFSYASTNWENIRSQSDLADGFRYYCKSRDLTIDGSAANVVTTFTTQTFNDLCNGLGIDITQLQAEIKAEYDSSGKPIKFLYSSSGIAVYNRIFAQFLQDNELSVGDTISQDNPDYLYNGYSIQDDNFNVYLLSYNDGTNNILGSRMIGYSTYNNMSIGDEVYKDYYFGNNKYTLKVTKGENTFWGTSDVFVSYYKNDNLLSSITLVGNLNGYTNTDVYLIRQNNGSVSFGILRYDNTFRTYMDITGSSSSSANIFVFAPTEINNNNYEGDTIINNNGIPEDDSPANPLPPDNPYDDPDPTPTTPDGDDWDIDMPDLDINWILTGKEKKFPFDIPFNVMFALSLLNAEPEAPHIEGTLDFGFTEWDYELDLSDFDDVAEICRNFEFLAFLIGLMLMTKRLIWG